MRSAARYVAAVAATVILLGTGTAAAQQAGGWKNELSGGMGFSVGLTEYTPGGFKMENEYGRRFTDLVWLNVQLNFVLGGGYDTCYDPRINRYYDCSSHFNGDGLEMFAGVKFKFRKGKLQPHAKVGGGLVFSFFPGDLSAVGIAVRAGGGFKYWVIPRLAIGGEANFTVGPTFFNHDGGTHFYAALDFIGGIEFAF
jgi:hypothetical protein